MSSRLVQLKDANGQNIVPIIGASQISGTMPIEQGGTGAATITQAAKNLNVLSLNGDTVRGKTIFDQGIAVGNVTILYNESEEALQFVFA